MSAVPEPLLRDRNCSRCGQAVASDEFLQFDHQFICASCKPFYLQQLREGVPTEAEAVRYAGFWIRGGAVFIDGLLLYVIEALVWVAAGDTWKEAFGFDPQYSTMDEWSMQDWMSFAATHLASMAYFTVMVGRYGGTIGKLALGLRIVNVDGQPMTYARAFYRELAGYLSTLALVLSLPGRVELYLLPCLMGFVMAAFDSQKRALHDRICGTRVIRRSKTWTGNLAKSPAAS